jgi:hypothetical protein
MNVARIFSKGRQPFFLAGATKFAYKFTSKTISTDIPRVLMIKE